MSSPARGATALSDAVAGISAKTDAASAATASLSGDLTDLVARYRLTNAGRCALLVMGTTSSSSAPVYFIPGPAPVAGLQADVIVGPGITVTNVTTGPQATVDGKAVQSAPVPGGERFILFGLNQNAIGAGNMANVSFDLAAASAGPHILGLVNFNATSPGGSDVPLCVTTGVITK